MKRLIPIQTLDNLMTRGAVEMAEDSGKALQYLFITNLIMQQLIGGIQMMILVRVMTMMLHLPLTNVSFPSLPLMVNSEILPWALFDITENDYGLDITSIVDLYDYEEEIDDIFAT